MTTPNQSTLLALCAIFLLAAGCGDPPDTPNTPSKSAQVDALFTHLAPGVQPGAAVMVVQNGTIVHQAGYGYADLEKQTPVTPDTSFRLASVSKQFTAAAVLALADDGKLSIDDPVAHYLPALAPYNGVTIRHLLTHTGGLPEYYDTIDTDKARPTNADALALLGQMASPDFAPGERYAYSNPGYDMLAPLVEGASGMEFAAFMKERIFEPAGMTSALIHDHRPPVIPNRALGYAPDGDAYAPNDDDPLNGIVGSGGMYASLNDFFHWDQALYSDSPLNESSIEAAFTPMQLNDGTSTDYGFGWRIDEYDGRPRVRHGGSWVGFRTHIARYPDDAFSIVILSNRADMDPESYIDPITDIWLGER